MIWNPTPLTRLPPTAGFDRVYIKDESCHPTGTFKDRLVRAALTSVPESAVIATISYGNTALSLAYHISMREFGHGRGRPRPCVLLPQDMGEWALGPSTLGTEIAGRELRSYLASRLDIIDLPVSGAILSESEVKDAVTRQAGRVGVVIDITEGIEVPVYARIMHEAIAQLGRIPDVCLVPFGAGILCNQVKDALRDTKCCVVPLSVADRSSAARMLFGPAWVDVSALARDGVALSRHRSPDRTGSVRVPYPVYLVSEREVADGLSHASALGISAEPSGCVGLGVLSRLGEIVPGLGSGSAVVIVLTGNGLDGFAKVINKGV